MIIDSHLHLPVGYADLNEKKRALLDELDRNGVEKGIIISDSCTESVIGSTRECAELFREDERIKLIAGISPLIDFEAQMELCRDLLADKDIIGLKIYTGHEHFYCTDRQLFPVYDLAAEFDVPVLFHTGWDDAQYAAPEIMHSLAVSRPENTFVYCHCYYPDTDICFDTLGDCGNIYFDTSSVADDIAKTPAIKASLEKAIERMPERFIFGSDFGSCSQEAHLAFARELDISDTARDMLMHRNSMNIYRIEEYL